ncbi:hypothetical protein [Frankia canadensis]|uniref:hypothetical protein n=1 Tax=Frankia canadensis TaxID=1836972 RepID=UPI001056A637|nr:hypothetical protein [Frankia canadensis]
MTTGGPRSDGEVVRQCGGYFTGPQYTQILRRFTPGSPPTHASVEHGGASLPWATVCYAPRAGDTMLGLAVRSWRQPDDEIHEGDGRPVMTTGFLCVPFASLRAAPVSYTGLYDAALRLDPDSHPDDAEPIEIDVAAFRPDDVQIALAELGVDVRTAAATAAALLAHPVRVYGAPAGEPWERTANQLRYLEAIASLLPYGQRARLVASTWCGQDGSNRVRLAFGSTAGVGATDGMAVPWGRRDRILRTLRGDARTYYHLLVGLIEERHWTLTDVATCLADLRDPRPVTDAGYAVDALARLIRLGP